MIVECPGCRSRYDVSGRPAGTRARCRCGTVFSLPEPHASAGALSCPNCGGVVAAGAHNCQFCSVELLVRACPRCFAKIFHGHAHCPHCGAGVSVPARANPDGSTSARGCPACAGSPALLGRLVGDVLLDECGTCHGIWLDTSALDRVVRERGERSMAPLRELGAPSTSGVMAAQPAPAAAPPAAGQRMYRQCPDCATVMNRVNFARRSGIIIDVCRAHGTWFDPAELPRVVDFVLKGGVEESNRKEVEELRADARRLAAEAQASRASAAWSAHIDSPFERRLDGFGAALGLIGRMLGSS